MQDIGERVHQILTTFYNGENAIICDNGVGNVLMIDGSPLQFDFVDSAEPRLRDSVEDMKIKFLNDVMDLFFEVQRYVALYEPEYLATMDDSDDVENVAQGMETMELT